MTVMDGGTTLSVRDRLLAGPSREAGAETFAQHRGRLGDAGAALRGRPLIDELIVSGLLGRGGAGFPVGRKWRGLREGGDAPTVILVNGAEGEPLSAKDRVLMRRRPHLVLDGAALAADALGAEEIVVYVGEEHDAAREAMERAIAERLVAGDILGRPIRMAAAPMGYVSGEASAAVNFVNTGNALPTAPPRPSESGVRGRPTLVQNVESLACVALIARFGAAWWRQAGRGRTRGTGLVTVGGAAGRRGVLEIELGSTVGEVAALAETTEDSVRAVLLGGYFGRWIEAREAWTLALDPLAMRDAGLSFGCGLLWFLEADACPVAATARIMRFMAAGSARQCGPCALGLGAIGETTSRLAATDGDAADLEHLRRWASLVRGRGACHHPDGAAEVLVSALETFGEEFRAHALRRPCRTATSCRAVA